MRPLDVTSQVMEGLCRTRKLHDLLLIVKWELVPTRPWTLAWDGGQGLIEEENAIA